jgi:uroporphyrinogen-III decarboxylase
VSLNISKGAALKGLLYTKGLHLKLKPASRMVACMMGKPDYVPVVAAQIHEHSMTVAKADPKRFFLTDGRYSVAIQYYVSKWYGFEMPLGMPPDSYNFEVEALGGKLLKSGMHIPSIDQSNPLIKTPEDLTKVKLPIRKDSGRIPFLIDTMKTNAELGGGIVSGFFCAPFSFLCGIHSYTGVIRDLRKNPEFMRRLFTWAIDDVLLPYLLMLKDATGAKKFVGADAWAAWPNVDKKILTEFIFPANRDFTQKAKKQGLTISSSSGDYCEENPAKFDAEIMKWCWYNMSVELMGRPMLMMGMGKTELWPMNIMKSYIRENTTKKWTPPVMAGPSASFTRDSTPQGIAAFVKRLIDNFGRNGRILLDFPQITADTPPVNVHSFFHAAKLYGTYPIPEDLNKIKFDVPKFEPYDTWFKREQAEGRVIKF